ncbi:hypothetical protein JKP88DRAFT_264989 [Tribonema minus]|uniref:SMP-30/Gluconolactonase/LRE-like region domain-containing protein n=1 Tax=Tribonema minus TaxID=303371 RepID=A0A835YLY3_9STRA|nr:hypothetical protein JKP88DRAFT_264989 [Tribonema minus]
MPMRSILCFAILQCLTVAIAAADSPRQHGSADVLQTTALRESAAAPVEEVNATLLYGGGDDGGFGTYIEGCTVDGEGRAYALNYLRSFDGRRVNNTDGGGGPGSGRMALGEITADGDGAAWQPDPDGDAPPPRMRVRSMMGGSWNGAHFAPPAAMPPRPDGRDSKTVLLADQLNHRQVHRCTAAALAELTTVLLQYTVTQSAWLGDGLSTILATFCASPDMVEPNDLTVASNGRVFTSAMRWAKDNVIGDGDLWTCSPSLNRGGSEPTRLAIMGRTNGIDLSNVCTYNTQKTATGRTQSSTATPADRTCAPAIARTAASQHAACRIASRSPDEKTLYLSEAFNVNFTPISNVVWAYDVDIESGTVANKRLFVDFEKLDGSQGSDVDGLRTDVEGNVYVVRNGHWQVNVFAPDGTLARRIYTTVRYPTNLDFGGPDGRTLFIVGRCLDAPWGQGDGCVDTIDVPAAGRTWSMLQPQ